MEDLLQRQTKHWPSKNTRIKPLKIVLPKKFMFAKSLGCTSWLFVNFLLVFVFSFFTVNLISAEVTFFISGLMFALIVEEWVWDYAITVTLIHVGLTTVGKQHIFYSPSRCTKTSDLLKRTGLTNSKWGRRRTLTGSRGFRLCNLCNCMRPPGNKPFRHDSGTICTPQAINQNNTTCWGLKQSSCLCLYVLRNHVTRDLS